MAAHVAKGDMVVVTKGREKGKRGAVKRILQNGRVEVEKLNMVKRHTKPTQKNPQGGIQDIEGSIALSNVSLWCEGCAAPRRAKKVFDSNGQKSRACVKCSAAFANPGL